MAACSSALTAWGGSWPTDAEAEPSAGCYSAFFRLSLSENLYGTCTSLGWSSNLLLLGMILDIFNVLDLRR